MPELPEVEIISRGLHKRVKGKTIKDVSLTYEKLLRDYKGKVLDKEVQESFLEVLKGQKIENISRRGKYIVFEIGQLHLLIHLRMTGKFSSDPDMLTNKHSHFVFYFTDDSFVVFNDTRKFATFQVIFDKKELDKTSCAQLGPEPLGEDFTPEYLFKEMENSKRKAKCFLLTQEKIAGIGNIYADEILFQAGVAPKRPVSSLSKTQIRRIHEAAREKLQQGIDSGGASIKDYVNDMGEKGNFQNFLKVYGKKGENCPACDSPLVNEKVGGRGSTWCPYCQKEEADMKVIGLTGGIASGKTTITNYLLSKGIKVVDGDLVARQVVEPASEGLKEIINHFGTEYLAADASLDRKKLGALVFNNPQKLEELNGIIHPLVRQEFARQIKEERLNGKAKFMFLDAALLIESKMTDLVDELWLVYADQEKQIERIIQRDKINREEALSVINSQMPLDEKKQYADVIIDNNKKIEDVYKHLDDLLSELD